MGCARERDVFCTCYIWMVKTGEELYEQQINNLKLVSWTKKWKRKTAKLALAHVGRDQHKFDT